MFVKRHPVSFHFVWFSGMSIFRFSLFFFGRSSFLKIIFRFFLHRRKKLPTPQANTASNGRVPFSLREESRFVREAVCRKTDYLVVRAYSDKYRTELPHKITLL